MGECDMFAVEKEIARKKANCIRILDKAVDKIPVTRTLAQTIDDFAKAQFSFSSSQSQNVAWENV